MLTGCQISEISSLAWVPEHLVEYVVAVTGKEPHLIGEYLCYSGPSEVVVVGYPIRGPFQRESLGICIQKVREAFPRRRIVLLAPELPPVKGLRPRGREDFYFKLELRDLRPKAKVRNMLKRASREIEVLPTREISREHMRLLEEFLDSKALGPQAEEVIRGIPKYVSQVDSSILLSAWSRERKLVAFTVGHLAGGPWGFYMFNITSPSIRVPGACDLLLYRLISEARERGKRFLNLGLGISKGVSFFKEKWGAWPFVPYKEAEYEEGGIVRGIHAALRSLRPS